MISIQIYYNTHNKFIYYSFKYSFIGKRSSSKWNSRPFSRRIPKLYILANQLGKKWKTKTFWNCHLCLQTTYIMKISYLENRTCDREKSELNFNKGPTLSCFKLRFLWKWPFINLNKDFWGPKPFRTQSLYVAETKVF